jgi:pimeloyl-ACP methyl ester carboxylesterase
MLLCVAILILSGCNPIAANGPAADPPALDFTFRPTETAMDSTHPAEAATAGSPAFEEGECNFEVPEGFKPRCGTLTVPENREQPNGRTIRLGVAIFKSSSPNPAADPVIHLIGGPGSSALRNARPILLGGGEEILQQRDYILIDQRGTRFSEPYLFCQPYDEYLWNAREQNLSLAEYNSGALQVLDACVQSWRKDGIDLAAYNSMEGAADVDDLRKVLGYEKVNLYGISYGTRLALNVMRDFPAGIRSVIIDSVYPAEANLDLDLALNAYRSLQKVILSCLGIESCASRYGDSEAKFYAVIDQLEATPVQLEVYGPYRDQPYLVYLDGDLFIDVIFGMLYSMESIADIPYLIQTAYEGKYGDLAEIAGGVIGAPTSTGLFWSSTCREEVPFEIGLPESLEAAVVPSVLRDHFSPQYAFEVCTHWNIPPAAEIESQAVVSDIPTLIFSGSYDPVTPPGWAALAAQTFATHYYYEFPDMSHGVMRSNPCALQIGMAFLDDPLQTPDTACMDEGD